MKTRLLNIFKSFAMAFAVVLSLSCCGVGDEALIDEITTETTEATETTISETTGELTTPEITTEEITETTIKETTETTTDETEEVTTEETTLTIPDEGTILASLSDEEKEVWLSMPDIVTIRLLRRYDEDEEDFYSEFLYTEVIYIDKTGQTKKFISPDKLAPSKTECTIEWINDQISRNEDAELINVADIHTLIKFYNSFMEINSNTKWVINHTIGLAEYIERHYWFEIFGVRNNYENELETIRILDGDAGDYYMPRHYTDEGEPIYNSGRELVDLYLKIDPFMVDAGGGVGYLVGEDG